jgi:hypothetical protein
VTARRPLGRGPAPSVRDVSAVAAASGHVRHGKTTIGGQFITCLCPKEPCGGVRADRYRENCPEHGGGRTPVQIWHWADECPGQRCPEEGSTP